MLSGIPTAGIQRPFVCPNLLDHPSNEQSAGLRFERLPADSSVRLIDRLPQLWGVAGSFPPAALAARCATLQLVCDSGGSATDGSGNGSYSVALFDENFYGTSLFSPKI